jgi:hypothetical protein
MNFLENPKVMDTIQPYEPWALSTGVIHLLNFAKFIGPSRFSIRVQLGSMRLDVFDSMRYIY